jgi:hypothetical protein
MSKDIENKEPKFKAESSKKSLIAKKDHVILHNEYKLVIKEGDDLSKKNIPEIYIPTLKTEKVI